MREAEIEEVLHRRFIDATSLPFTVIDRQVQLPGRRRVDLLAEAQDKRLWAIELKAGQVVPPDVGQLLGYLPLLRSARGLDAQPMLMAPSIRPDAAVLAASSGVRFEDLDVLHLLRLQRQLQLQPTAPAYQKGVNLLASLREPRDIDRYYSEAFPRYASQAPAATTFTSSVLTSLPGAAMGWRASSGWVCLTIPTGDVVASVELKPTGLQLGFGVRVENRSAYVESRLGGIVNDPRSIGIWVHAQRAEGASRLHAATAWYRSGVPAWLELRSPREQCGGTT